MKATFKKELILSSIILTVGLFFVKGAYAATLSNVSDTVTTSRPSSAAPLNADQAAAAGQVAVVDNGAQYLASDSAVIYKDTGETTNAGLNIASMSAQIAGSPLTRNVYFTSTITNTHHKGDALIVNVTAKHTVVFTTVSTVPVGGKIVITFPGAGSNIASPSASTFSFNNLQTGNVSASFSSGSSTCTFVVSAPTITCTVATAQISGGVAVTITVGSSTPALINPTKAVSNTCTNLGTSSPCTADQWKISIKTQDGSSIDLDSAKAVVATIESVQVQGTVDAYITFTITGLPNATNITTQNASCTGGDVTNSGLDATATFVNLGNLASGTINISAQELSVSTNGSAGYAITATSSGRFLNPSSGFWISDANGGNGLTANNTPAPAVFPASGNPAYGIHPCGADVTTGTWANAATAFSSGAKYSNPWNTGTNSFSASIASFGAPANARTTEIEYAATAALTTPAGTYSNIFTYVATPIF